jgi:hypothetical protein
MRKLILTAAASTFALPVLALALVWSANAADKGASAPGAAMPASCGTKNGPNLQNQRVGDAALVSPARQHNGPSEGCRVIGALQPGDDAVYYCYMSGDHGRTWTFLRNLRTGVVGWTRDDLLRNNGSNRYCGF